MAKSNLRALYNRTRQAVGFPVWEEGIESFAIPQSHLPALAQAAAGELERIFYGHRGRRLHKWVHYLPVYERHLAPWRGRAARFLEIGVSGGGSLEMWRAYLGPTAVISGIDIEPACADCVDAPNRVFIGSQDDPIFLRSVVAEMGGIDVVLDDGSHVAAHQRASFDALFPLLAEGGLYIIEDAHTAYWAAWGGGVRRSGTAIEAVKAMIDDMHAWYHPKSNGTPAKEQIGAIHIYDSIVVIEKRRKQRPGHIKVGAGI